jgi:IS4 transposase
VQGILNNVANHDVCVQLTATLKKNEALLLEEILHYAIAHEYAKYTSTLKEPWRLSIYGLTKTFVSELAIPDYVLELGPDQDFSSDFIADFAEMDLEMEESQILSYYARRWSIEVFFKDAKQMLYMVKEQSNTFDALIACYSLVMIQSLHSRARKSPNAEAASPL